MNRCTTNHFKANDCSHAIDIANRTQQVRQMHTVLPEYHATPCISLTHLALTLDLKQVFVKNEAERLRLNAFKALGASYAIFRFISRERMRTGRPLLQPQQLFSSAAIPANSYTFCTATDGNHGRGVAWTARRLNQRAVIFMPKGTVPSRIENIRAEGADVRVVDGTYDVAVGCARDEAAAHGWTVISDTSWDGYEQIPRWISEGYLTIFDEIDEQLDGAIPDVVFVPGGVGALAATAAWWYRQDAAHSRTRLACVEPTAADCLYRSIVTPEGSPITTDAPLNSIMAGLNCGTPSPVAWPSIRSGFDAFVAIDDHWALEAMRTYYHPQAQDPQIISGESGAATLGALLAICRDERMASCREELRLDRNASVLLLNTEGNTDPVHFETVVATPPSR